MKTFSVLLLVLSIWLTGCVYSSRNLAGELEKLITPVTEEYLVIYENGHSWEGIPAEDRQSAIDQRKEAVSKIVNRLKEEKK